MGYISRHLPADLTYYAISSFVITSSLSIPHHPLTTLPAMVMALSPCTNTTRTDHSTLTPQNSIRSTFATDTILARHAWKAFARSLNKAAECKDDSSSIWSTDIPLSTVKVAPTVMTIFSLGYRCLRRRATAAAAVGCRHQRFRAEFEVK